MANGGKKARRKANGAPSVVLPEPVLWWARLWAWLVPNVSVLQSLATIIAIVIGGYWTYFLFVQGRDNFPQAVIAHSVQSKRIADGQVWLQLAVTVENVGKRVLKITDLDIRLQQVLPLPANIRDAIERRQPLVSADGFTIPWQGVCRYMRSHRASVEPNEREKLYFDFVVPASLRTVKIYTYFGNASADGEIGWSETTIADIPYEGGINDFLPSFLVSAAPQPRLCDYDVRRAGS